MKIPNKKTRAYLVLAFLYRSRPCTVLQGVGGHTDFGTGMMNIVDIYERLALSGCVDVDRKPARAVFSISAAARRVFDGMPCRPPQLGQVAGPAYRPPPKPLDVSRVRIVETRPGALDYRDIPTLIGNHRHLPGQLK